MVNIEYVASYVCISCKVLFLKLSKCNIDGGCTMYMLLVANIGNSFLFYILDRLSRYGNVIT